MRGVAGWPATRLPRHLAVTPNHRRLAGVERAEAALSLRRHADVADTTQDNAWLLKNRNLRMDANSAIFRDDERRIFLERYEFAKGYCAGRKVLDGASGTGYGSSVLGTAAREVVGIDISADAVEYATRTYGTPNVSFRKSFVELTPFAADSFEVVVSFETVEHTLCPRSHLMEVARILEPKGRAILSIPNAWGLKDHHFFDFNAALLRQITTEFFSGAELFCQNVSPPGIRPVAGPDDERGAHCILAVCRGPRKENVAQDRIEFMMNEIYTSAFGRHNDFLELRYRHETSLKQRAVNWLRARLRG
jgi:2-polyprenyl-3-methyl-5-hydroxy-6-metoxy-1,4-benzoquinol methylase